VEERRGAFVLMPLPPGAIVLPAGRAAREVRGAIVWVWCTRRLGCLVWLEVEDTAVVVSRRDEVGVAG
jgi:hypothetical protein